MVQGIIGSFDISGEYGFTARIFYSEQYDSTTGEHIVSITGISIRSTTYGNWWYPHGTISVDGETVGAMNNSNPATHRVSLTAGSGWHTVSLYYGDNNFPWDSSIIMCDIDGNKQVTISVDFLLYRDSSAPRPSFKGSHTVELTYTPIYFDLSISQGVGTSVKVERDGVSLFDGDMVTYGDQLAITFDALDGYCLKTHTVNGAAFVSGGSHMVTGSVTVAATADILAYPIGNGTGHDLHYAFIGDGAGGGKYYVAFIGTENGPVPYGMPT